MKREDIKKAFYSIQPDQATKDRMLNNVLAREEKSYRKSTRSKILFRAIPAAAMVLAVTVGLFTFFNNNKDIPPAPENTGSKLVGDDKITEDADLATEPLNQFKIDDKTYYIMSDSNLSEFGFSKNIDKKDIGEKITTIKADAAPQLIGRPVYEYLPAKSRAVLAVKTDDGYILYKFYGFDSYMNNRDEDAAAYLELYGIRKAEDIAKIEFVKQGGSTITVIDRSQIKKFYDYYSVLKDASDKYFMKLYSYKNEKADTRSSAEPNQIPPDYMDRPDVEVDSVDPSEGGIAEDLIAERQAEPQAPVYYDTGNTGSTPGNISGSTGISSDIFNDSVYIRIYTQSGIYFETIYYPNFGFISRYEVSDDFESFLKNIIK